MPYEAITKENWKEMGLGCSKCDKPAPYYDQYEFDAPPGWFYYEIINEDDEEICVLACSRACQRLTWKQEPRRPQRQN